MLYDNVGDIGEAPGGFPGQNHRKCRGRPCGRPRVMNIFYVFHGRPQGRPLHFLTTEPKLITD